MGGKGNTDSVNTSQGQALGSLPKVRDHVLVTAKVPDRRSKVSDMIHNPANMGWMLNMFDSNTACGGLYT